MSGQRSSLNDATSRLALLSLGIEATSVIPTIQAMLDSLSKLEAAVFTMRFGLVDGEPKTLGEISEHYEVSRERIRQIERKCIEKLRKQSRNSPLAVMDGEAVVGFVDVRHTGADPSLRPSDDLVWCAQCHKRKFIPQSGVPTGGRTRVYCSNACRQAAYRARRRAADEAQ